MTTDDSSIAAGASSIAAGTGNGAGNSEGTGAAHSEPKRNEELKNTTYELFIAALSILSILNLLITAIAPDEDVVAVALIIDGVLSIIFLGDFLYRLFTAESKTTYFLRQFGWADLLASLPFPRAKLLRLFRLFRAGRLIRHYGPKKLLHEFVSDRGGSALLTLLFFMILVLEFGAMVMLQAERHSPDANIKTASDAVWYVYVTITTVGYGDRYPITAEGRLVGILVMTMGVGLFGTLTGFLANAFLAPQKDEQAAQPSGLPMYSAEIDKLSAEVREQATILAALKQLLDEQRAAQGKNKADPPG